MYAYTQVYIGRGNKNEEKIIVAISFPTEGCINFLDIWLILSLGNKCRPLASMFHYGDVKEAIKDHQ
jgi:hypothetical protein